MRRCILSILTILFLAVCANAQKITDSGYRTVGQIKTDGTIQDASYKIVGHIKSDGNIQDSSYKTVGTSSPTERCRMPAI